MQEEKIRVLNVMDKATGLVIKIKADYFKPEKYEKIEGKHIQEFTREELINISRERRLVNVVGTNLVGEPALAAKIEKVGKLLTVEYKVKDEVETDRVELENLKFFELKKYAKENGVKVTNKMKKAEILKQLNAEGAK